MNAIYQASLNAYPAAGRNRYKPLCRPTLKEGSLPRSIRNPVRASISALLAMAGFGIVGCTVYTPAPQSDVVVVSHPPPPPPDGGVVVASDSPPPDQVEVVGVAPWPDGYWIGGHYIWGAGGWYWSRGYWGHRPYGGVWARGYYRRGPRGVVWVGGHWR
jgi:hypothetical protein